VKERPILFSGPMVLALLAGTKTQTRRVMTREVGELGAAWIERQGDAWVAGRSGLTWKLRCPYGEPGDRLWVRERIERDAEPGDDPEWCGSRYAADGAPTVADAWPWQRPFLPPMHMPRGLCRIRLAVTSIRVERLQEITEDDAKAEGVSTSVVDPSPRGTKTRAKNYVYAREAFADLWDEINDKRPGCAWSENPWLWVIGFEVVR
jgi:hypothetical protein